MDIDRTVDEVSKMTRSVLIELFEKWNVMYDMDEEKRTQKLQRFIYHVREVYEEMTKSEENRKLSLISDAENKLKEHSILLKELGLGPGGNLYNEKEPLMNLIGKLDDSISKLATLKTVRMVKLNSIYSKVETLSEILGESLAPVISGVPTQEDLDRFENIYFKLNEEKCLRETQYSEMRKRIMELMTELELRPQVSLEKEVWDNNEETARLTLEVLKQVRELEAQVENKYKNATAQVGYLMNDLQNLWSKINIDQDIRDDFVRSNSGVGATTTAAIKEEIARCLEIRKTILKPLLEAERRRIEDIWDRLTLTESERLYFEPFFSELTSEDILNLHELEVQRLEQLYEKNRGIYELAQKRSELWERMLHLESAANDKARYNNRGGQLLKEEKERKIIETRLPKIDQQLTEVLKEYQERENSPFYFYGQDLLEKINTEWDQRIAERNEKINARKMEHNKRLEMEAKLGAQFVAQKRKLGASTTNVSTKKLRSTPSRDHSANNQTITLNKEAILQESQDEDEPDMRRRRALEELNCPTVAHSSPRTTPPRTLLTPGKSYLTPGKGTGGGYCTPVKSYLTPGKGTGGGYRTPVKSHLTPKSQTAIKVPMRKTPVQTTPKTLPRGTRTTPRTLPRFATPRNRFQLNI